MDTVMESTYFEKARELYELKELERLGLTPELPQRDQILTYMALVLKWNLAAGLVSPNDENNLFIRHFCDSLQPLLLFGFKKGGHILDIGSGGGFPSVPIFIFRPDLTIWLVESNRKKCSFLNEVKEQLELDNLHVFNGRSEDFDPSLKFDYVISRGLTSLMNFSELAKPHLNPDGRMYSYKTQSFTDELEKITNSKETNGVCISEIAEYDLGNQIFGLNLVSMSLV